MFRTISLLFLLVAAASAAGGNRDSHGCFPSAGYKWCETLGKCHRPWEQGCPANEEAKKEQRPALSIGIGPQLVHHAEHQISHQTGFGMGPGPRMPGPPKEPMIAKAPISGGLGPQIAASMDDNTDSPNDDVFVI